MVSMDITYLVTLKGAHTLATLDAGSRKHASGCCELPHLDGLVQATTDEIATVGRKGNGIDAILVAIRVF